MGPAAEESLLPDADIGALSSCDPLSILYLFEAKDQSAGVTEGSKRLEGLQTERDQQLVQEQQAIAKEAEAAKNHGFWDDVSSVFGEVAKVAGIIAAIAVTVCTAGSAAPVAALAIAGIVLSTASFVDGECHVLTALGVDPKVAGWIDTGMAVAGAICSFGAGAAAGGQAAIDTAGTVARTSNVFGRAASVASGAAEIGQGAAQIEVGQARASCDHATADELLAVSQSAHALRFMQLIVAETESSDADSQQIMNTITVTKGIRNTTVVDCATGVRG